MAKRETTPAGAAASSEVEARMRALDDAEFAVDAAFQTGRADRATITKRAQEDAHEAVRMVGEAMEADEAADEARRLAVIAEHMGDRSKTRDARKRAREAHGEAKRAHRAATQSAKRAYDAIKFSQPNKLGFMRFVQLSYGASIAMTLLLLVLTSRDTIVYDSVTIFSWITIILDGVGLWFFINYFKITKPYVIAVSAFEIVTIVVTSLASGKGLVGDALLGCIWNGFLILYFLFSKRVDAVLVNDFASYKPRQNVQLATRRRGWPFVRNLIIYFVVFSILGHWMEAGMCQFIRLGLVQGEYDPSNTMLWRDWLYPYPMEGAAVVIIALVLHPFWQFLLKRMKKPIYAYAISFVVNALACSVIEFTMGLIVNANHQLWDYSNMFCNIMGQVCLQNALAFGVAASLIAWVVYPLMENWLARVPNDTMNIVFVVVAVIGGILWSLYLIDPPQNHQVEDSPQMVAEQRAQRDRSRYESPIEDVDNRIDKMRTLLDESSDLPQEERDGIERDLDKLDADLEGLKGTLHLTE